MNKPIVISAWLLSCAGAFGLGTYLQSSSTGDAGSDATSAGGVGPVLSAGGAAAGGAGAGGTGPKVPGLKKATADNPFAAYIRGGVISPDDMKTLMKDVLNENDPIKQSELFTKLLGQLTPENAKEAYAQLREMRGGWGRGPGGRGGMEKSQMFLNAWGRIDGEGAMATLMAQRDARQDEDGEGGGRGGRGGRGGPGGRGGFESFEMMGILSGWATSDAAEATEYLNSVEGIEDREKTMLQNGIVQGLLVNGVGAAMDYVGNLPTGDNSREWMMRSIADEVLEGGVDAAASWVTSISDAQLKEGALNTVVDNYVREDLDAAADWVASMADQPYASDAVREVAERMADSDPQQALAWVDSIAAESQPAAYKEVVNEWARDNVEAASEYLLAMNDSPNKDQAITGLTDSIRREDPNAAIIWAQEIDDPQLQQETVVEVARGWYYSRERDEASAWLETSGLAPETVEQIIAEPQRGDFRGFGGGGGGRGGRGR